MRSCSVLRVIFFSFYLFVYILFQNGYKVTAFFQTTKYNSKFFQFDYL